MVLASLKEILFEAFIGAIGTIAVYAVIIIICLLSLYIGGTM